MNPVIARRHRFSAAHVYQQAAFTHEQNVAVFGPCYSKYGHGHNYTLEVFVQGAIDKDNGLIINVNDLDTMLQKVCEPFDHKHISFEHPDFAAKVPTTENLTSHFFVQLKAELALQYPDLTLNRVRLFETDDLWATATASLPAKLKGVHITREVIIRSIHHLENHNWTPTENQKFYGMCYGVHGHDYHVQVTAAGSVDETTGLAVDRDALDAVIENEIRLKYDGVDLNRRFQSTSCEQLACEFYKILKPLISGLVKIGIQETRKNYFEFPAG